MTSIKEQFFIIKATIILLTAKFCFKWLTEEQKTHGLLKHVWKFSKLRNIIIIAPVFVV